MITLDGNSFETFQTDFSHTQTKIGSTDRGLTGLPVRVESGFFDNSYSITLLCTTLDIANLRNSYAKVDPTGTPPGNLLDFTDEEGLHWNPNSVGDGLLTTGVYFISMGEPKPLSVGLGWSSGNRFTVTINLVCNSSALMSA